MITHPKYPSPADSLTDKSTDDRTKDGSTIGGRGKQRDSEPTLFIIPDIRDRSSREC